MYRLLLAWCIGVYYCCAGVLVFTITSICVIYWLFVCVVLVCLCWLLSLSVCSAVYFAYIGLFLCCLPIIPLIRIYRFISLLFVFICPFGVLLVMNTDNNTFIVCVISLYLYYWVGIIIYLSLLD